MSESELLKLKSNNAINLAKETTDIDVIVCLSKHSDSQVRKASLKQMCPCRVRDDINMFWDRVLDMIDDRDATVRAQVLHILCDGSPKHLEHKIIECIELFNRDVDAGIRRKAHKVLSSYRRTGKWNIL
jgi:hypothetical protein